MEDTSALWPVTIEATSFKEPITFFEQEVIGDELVLILGAHSCERVEFTGKLALECAAGLYDLLLNLIALLASDAWSKRVISEVATDSDSGRFDHSGIIIREWWTLKLGVVQVAYMPVCLSVSVIGLNYFVHERCESDIGVMRTGINTDSRVNVLAARENGRLEWEAMGILLILELVPDVFCKELSEH